jgi:hypothetical protein
LISFNKFLKPDKRINADNIDKKSINKNNGFDFDKDSGFRSLLINNLYFHPTKLTEKGVSSLRNNLLIERNNYIKINKIQLNRFRIVRRGFIFNYIFGRRFRSTLLYNQRTNHLLLNKFRLFAILLEIAVEILI